MLTFSIELNICIVVAIYKNTKISLLLNLFVLNTEEISLKRFLNSSKTK